MHYAIEKIPIFALALLYTSLAAAILSEPSTLTLDFQTANCLISCGKGFAESFFVPRECLIRYLHWQYSKPLISSAPSYYLHVTVER